MKNIVIIGGGTGTFTLLSGLREFPTNNSVVVASSDDGGSTGRLRRDLNVFPPGDLRQCLLGLSYTEKLMQELFAYRFERGELKGHTVGNIILAALSKISGGVEPAIKMVAKMLNVRGEVVPVTLFPTQLSAVLQDGKKILGEHNIDEPRVRVRPRIKQLTLKPSSPSNPRALASLKKADVIVFGPGDLFTSVLPNLLVKGVAKAIDDSSAKRVLVVNLMTKPGQTEGFRAENFVKILNQYLGRKKIEAVIVNTKKPGKSQLGRYQKAGAKFVEPETDKLKKSRVEVIATDLLSENVFTKANSDVLERSFLRHDPKKLAKLIYNL